MDTAKYSIEEYVKELSSKAPIPGGGGVSALAGALSAALSSMVCNLTIGKKNYVAVEENILEILDEMHGHIQSFIKLADKDAEVFYPLSKIYSVKPNTEQERKKHEKNMEELLYNAASAPLEVMKEACRMIETVDYLCKKSSRLVVSDTGVAVSLLRSAVCGSMMNVAINVKYMKNREKAQNLLDEASAILETAMEKTDIIYREVLEGLL